MRAWLATAGVLLVLYGAAALIGAALMPSYLAAWLFCLAVPVGALPVVMGLELAGLGGSLHTGWLRWMLILLPVAALAGLPVLFFLPALYGWASHPPLGFAGVWFTQTGFILRMVVYLAVWSTLAILMLRPPQNGARAALCVGGLVLHAVIGTLAAQDWIMSLSPGLNAAGFGLLVMAGQSALALSIAVLLVPRRPHSAAAWLLAAMSVWAVLHFTQYLIVWSADRPDEIAWYMHRGGVFGIVTVWVGVTALAIPVGLLLLPGLAARPGVLGASAGMVVAAQMLAALWMVTPSVRGGFVLALPDVALPVLATATAAFLWFSRPMAVPS